MIQQEQDDIRELLELPAARRFLARQLAACGFGRCIAANEATVGSYNQACMTFEKIRNANPIHAREIINTVYKLGEINA